MERRIADWSGHVIICGYGRVGRSHRRPRGRQRARTWSWSTATPTGWPACPSTTLQGDATDDEVLRAAGIDRARVLVAALTTDADNLFLTVTARSLRPDLFIVARARQEASEEKLASAGADRVVNPQRIGGQRMAAFVLQPHVAEFLDVVMHDGSLEFRLEEVAGADRVAARRAQPAGRPHPRPHRRAGPGRAGRRTAPSPPTRRPRRSSSPATSSSPSAPRPS